MSPSVFWELGHAEDSLVRWDLLEGDIGVPLVAAVLALGLGIRVWAELFLLVEVLVHLGGDYGDLVVLVLWGGLGSLDEWVDVETRGG